MNKNKLVAITEKVKKKIETISVLLPEHYNLIFIQTAKETDIEIESICNLNDIENSVYDHSENLYQQTEKAIDAIDNEDKNALEEVKEDTLKLKEEISNLRTLVYEDFLTEAYNRKWIYDKYLKEDLKFKNSGCLVVIDMNDFKIINDSFGHLTGDKVLKFLVNHLKLTGGIISRYGGDEFVILFNEYSEINVNKIMHQNREKILSKTLKTAKEQFKISYSYAVSPFKENGNFNNVFEKADSQLYIDKKNIKERLKKKFK